MNSDKQTFNDRPESTAPPDPDIIDLPRRAIGTPQVLAGFIFLLGLMMLEAAFPAWLAAEDARRGEEMCYNWYIEEMEDYYEQMIDVNRKHIENITKSLKQGNASTLTEEERKSFEDNIRLCRKAISYLEKEREIALLTRDEGMAKNVGSWAWKKRFGYISTMLFALGAVALVFGAISLAFAIGTGRKWTWISILLLPITAGGGIAFLVLSNEYPRFNVVTDAVVPAVFLVAVAVILRRMVEWVAPVRDESLEGRDRLRRSHISRACAAVFVLLIALHVIAWWAFENWLERKVINHQMGIYFWVIVLTPPALIALSAVLLGIHRARLAVFGLLIVLAALDISAFALCVAHEGIPHYHGNAELVLAVVMPLTAALLFLYPIVAIAVMLVRPLGRKLFERPVVDGRS